MSKLSFLLDIVLPNYLISISKRQTLSGSITHWEGCCFPGKKCDDKSVAQTGWQTFFHIWIQLQKTLPVTTLLLLGPVTLLSGLKTVGYLSYIYISLICWVKDLFSCQTVNTIRPTHPWAAALILPLEVDGDAEKQCMIPASKAESVNVCKLLTVTVPTLHAQILLKTHLCS